MLVYQRVYIWQPAPRQLLRVVGFLRSQGVLSAYHPETRWLRMMRDEDGWNTDSILEIDMDVTVFAAAMLQQTDIPIFVSTSIFKFYPTW